jgi:hypothetical protein
MVSFSALHLAFSGLVGTGFNIQDAYFRRFILPHCSFVLLYNSYVLDYWGQLRMHQDNLKYLPQEGLSRN